MFKSIGRSNEEVLRRCQLAYDHREPPDYWDNGEDVCEDCGNVLSQCNCEEEEEDA